MSGQFKSGDWSQLSQDAKSIRQQVFIEEQQIPASEEWDELDASSIHFVIYIDSYAIATARLTDDHRIGRVAVLKEYRGTGLGFKLMQQIIEFAQQQQRPFLILSAQCYATAFYEKLGFVSEGRSYLDCGIPHIQMQMHFA
ncbi:MULTISPECIES: GNAT family N-acetyltransferase [unclassified Acinetobacter]|uniref:GNAT family N-acetyltransferase n=1 Tax=unclassified Acinetobacter TaxID=196816 RepID=UPI0029342481|nr:MULTISPECIES: GNAT family N-acetyltransferase [unclassified Acinetobacter]WOE30363.1 GNAT family N-acetyltransferase [Acinetobacter sp. SAAs470]WOE38554.1 GNAT family N-acetyltransferase [Acinetobacter sp. SAAs474]